MSYSGSTTVSKTVDAGSIPATPARNVIVNLHLLRVFLFESVAIRTIRVYAEHIGDTAYYHNDFTGLEVDLIIELDDGCWAGIEIKWGKIRLK